MNEKCKKIGLPASFYRYVTHEEKKAIYKTSCAIMVLSDHGLTSSKYKD